MPPIPLLKATLLLAVFSPSLAAAADPRGEVQRLRNELTQLRRSHAARLEALEVRLRRAESARAEAPPLAAAPAGSPPGATAALAGTLAAPGTALPRTAEIGSAAPVAAPPVDAPFATSRRQAANAGANQFNPAMGVVLSGGYTRLSRDPAGRRLTGFALPGDAETRSRGFGLGESELSLSANIDPRFYGSLTLALSPDAGASVEEAFVQTNALGNGSTLRAGRYFSAVGYLNEQHAHRWDFIDNPLAYEAFLGTQFAQDGVQARWLLPSARYVELLAEAGNGANFPGAGGNRHGAGAAMLGVRSGGDWNASSNWLVGASLLRASPRGRQSLDTDAAGNPVLTAFSGRSTLLNLSGVWKWAPNGNATSRNLRLQGEYFRRRERGSLLDVVAATGNADGYASSQSGWYAQGIYQFMPRWKTGLRLDRLSPGRVDASLDGIGLPQSGFAPRRVSALLDWSPSEFSRIRLQLAQERSRPGPSDRQVFLQYQMSLGAHGAHGY